MRLKITKLLIIVFSFWAPSLAFAQSDTVVLPHWSSDRIIAVRKAPPADAVLFSVHDTVSSGTARADSIVELTRDWVEINRGADHRLEDQVLCRSFTWSDKAPLLTNDSCFARLAFSIFEAQNRVMIRRIASQENFPERWHEPYWDEANWVCSCGPKIV